MTSAPYSAATDPRPAGPPGTPHSLGAVSDDAGAEPTLEEVAALLDEVVNNVGKVLYGKADVVRLAVACLVAGGHLLVEDLPGVGKTTLAKALARSLGLEFRRVQFTADLLPSDVTGAMIFDRDRNQPVFRPGPVFANVLLADELNRASPKAQSALLESMEERQVSMDGESFPLPVPFMVIATQNPFDAAGTYLLPHSQRDRFLLRVSIGYPARSEEDSLLVTGDSRSAVDALPAVTDVHGLQGGLGSGRPSLCRPSGQGLRARPRRGQPLASRPVHRCITSGRARDHARGDSRGRHRRASLRDARRRPGGGRAGARAPDRRRRRGRARGGRRVCSGPPDRQVGAGSRTAEPEILTVWASSAVMTPYAADGSGWRSASP